MSSEDVLTQRQNKEFIQNPVLLCPLPRVYLHLIYSYIFMYISIYYVYIIYIYIIYTVKVPTRNLSMQNWLCYSMKHVKKNICICPTSTITEINITLFFSTHNSVR